ncbi:MAG: hypothetical protein AAGU18_10865 [Proteiniphilum sp.]
MILKNIQRWLSNSQRDYHEGLRYFNLFASVSKKTRYGQYLNNVAANERIRNDAQNSSRFSLLVDEIVRIEGDIRRSPGSFKHAIALSEKAAKAGSPKNKVPAATGITIPVGTTATPAGTGNPPAGSGSQSLTGEPPANPGTTISGSTENPDPAATGPGTTVGTGENQAAADPSAAGSGEQSATPSSTAPGEKSTLDSLPAEFDAAKARLKEIIPIMAKLHADMANETLADDKRLLIVKDLVSLDAERRAIWARIDNFLANGGTPIEKSADETLIEEKTLALGAQMQKRIDQLRENISRSEKSLAAAVEKGNKMLIANAEKRIVKYKEELETLESALRK